MSPHGYHQLLLTGKWYSEISPLLQQHLLDAAAVRFLQDEERLFARGDQSCGLYAALDGMVRISGIGGSETDPKEAVLGYVEPPDWFGEISIFDGQPRTHDAVADGPAVVLHVPHGAIADLLARHPQYWRELALLMSHKLRLMFAVTEEAALLPAPVRVARRLLLMAEGYGGRHDPTMRRRSLKVSQEQVSRMLSISRQTANQILKNLELQGLIKLGRKEIEIIDFDGLLGVVPQSDQ